MRTEVLVKEKSLTNSLIRYKRTEAGFIPEDWELIELGSLFDFIGGSQPPRSTFISNEKVDYIRLLQIRDYKTENYLTYIPVSLARRFCSSDDIMIGRYGPPIFQILRGLEGAYNVALIKAVPIGFYDNALAWHILKQESLFNFVEKLSQRSSGQTGVDLVQLKGYKIPLPKTKSEQTAIATALSDADALIRSLEQLIEKKKKIKQGAMQELLLGKRRLQGFKITDKYKPSEIGTIPLDWNIKQLSDLTILMTNGFVGTATIHYSNNDSDILYIQGYNVIENNFNFHGIKYVTKSFNSIHKKSCLIEGDLLTIQTGDVGLTTIIPKKLEGSNCHALIISRFRKDLVIPKYYSYYLNSKIGRARLKLIETGSTMKHINVGDLLNFKVPVPSKKEQCEIVIVLNALDEEISQLETKLNKIVKIKQGMMQSLLTGKIRLI